MAHLFKRLVGINLEIIPWLNCNYFSVFIFNVENFTNKNVAWGEEERSYQPYQFLSLLSHPLLTRMVFLLPFSFCIIMLLIFIYTVFIFFSLLWLIFLCPFVGWWTPPNNGSCFIISLIILYWYVIAVWISLVAACMAMFFLHAASSSTEHQLLRGGVSGSLIDLILSLTTLASFWLASFTFCSSSNLIARFKLKLL